LQKSIVKQLVGDSRDLVTLKYDDSISVALKVMREHKITSVPVADSEMNCIGVIDMATVVFSIISTMKIAGNLPAPLDTLRFEGKVFAQEKVGKLLRAQQRAKPLTSKDSLMNAATEFGRGVHQLLVKDSGNLVNVLSQSDLVYFLAKHTLSFSSMAQTTIAQLGWGRGEVVQISKGMPALHAVQLLAENAVHGIAIVDEMNRLVGNFSSTDLQTITEDKFQHLALPVEQFMDMAFSQQAQMKCPLYSSRAPIACDASSTLEAVLLRMALERVHRVYVVEPNMVLLGVISLTDVIQWCLT